jgi:hypothetical protein
MALSLLPMAWAGNPSGKIRTLVNEYRDEPGFEVVDMGGLALGLLRAAARTQVETPEDRIALDLFSAVKRLTVLDFSDAEAVRKDKFIRKVKRLLADEEVLLEAKDGGQTVKVYGLSSEDGNILEDIILLAEDTLISLKGKIRMDQLGELMDKVNR